MSNDIYTKYENGLEILLEKLANHPEYNHACTLAQRLQENIDKARRYGDPLDREASRAEIIEQLNRLAGLTLHASFSALCQPVSSSSLAAIQQAPELEAPPVADNNNQYHLPVDLKAMKTAVYQCSALLRQQKNTFADTNFHISREGVDQIVAWLLEDDETDKNVAMLLDQAGMGKTVVMRDVLDKLETNGTVVLAIKADRHLSGINKLAEIQEKLDLPEQPLHTVSELAKVGRVVVLVDQIDALSLSLAHDSQTLDVVLDFVARLRFIPNVRLLLSCRIFDRESDPRLKNIEVGNSFSLRPLTDEQVGDFLTHLGVDGAALSQTTRELLRIPLHLDLFARAITNQSKIEQLKGVASLQELYALIWQNIVLKHDVNSQLISERIEVINLFTRYMNEHQRITVPRALLQKPETAHLIHAAGWLSSNGILLGEGNTWAFLHQTFFDYCYARQFVEDVGDIVSSILASNQSIFERPKLQHIIEYLRGNDPHRYLHDLQRLLNAPNLRFHLYDLLLRWFGSLPNPTDDEWLLAQRMLNNEDKRQQLLRVMQANVGWLDHFRPTLQSWLNGNDSQIEQALSYLASILENAQTKVVTILMPFVGKSEQWDERIANLILRLRNWHSEDAIRLYEEIIYKQTSLERHLLWHIKSVIIASPKTGCRLLHHIFNLALDLHLEKMAEKADQDKGSFYLSSGSLFDGMRNMESSVKDALKVASESEPRLFVDEMLPWVRRVLALATIPADEKQRFVYDALSYNWYGKTFRIQLAFVHSLIHALCQVAQNSPDLFRSLATELAELPYETPQQLITHVYRALPEFYSQDALEFLLSDQRRLNIGDREQYDSRQLVKVIYPYLTVKQQGQLETYILNYAPIYKHLGIRGLQWRGIEQYRLLHAIPKQYLSEQGLRRYQEWGRKFPEYKIVEKPIISEIGGVGSPIEAEHAAKMSNRSWLRAMEKYRDNVRRPAAFKGGAYELSSVLASQIKIEPARFYQLWPLVPDDMDDAYATVFIEAFAEANNAEHAFFDAVRRFGIQHPRDINRSIARAVEKFVKSHHPVPDDILDMLISWVFGSMNDDEWWWKKGSNHGDAFHSYLNSDRGAALGAIMRILDARDTEEALNQKWQLVEYVVSDPSTALRVGVIRELIYMIQYDRQRSWALFERLITGHEILFESQDVREFLYWSFYKNFLAVQPYIMQMMNYPNEEVQERGAGLACIAAISDKVMESEEAQVAAKTLAENAIKGLPAWRRGAAHIYTYNMTYGSEIETQSLCQEKTCQLIDDPDEAVRQQIEHKFYAIKGEHFFSLRKFMEEYALASLHPLEHKFAEYLWEHGMKDSSWTLTIIQALLNKTAQPNQWQSGMEELMRLVLRIYMSPLEDEAVREEALDTFDLLMEQYGGIATKILSQWDRR